MDKKKKEKELCLMCKEKSVKNEIWMFQWKGEAGYMCEECGRKWYEIGNYLTKKAVEAIEATGAKVTWKDKFGEWRIYPSLMNNYQLQIMKDIEKQYKILFPEFTWDFE